MAIVGIPNTRVSDQFVRQRLLAQVQTDQASLLRLEIQLSTGYRFEIPSEDPVAAQRVMSLQRLLERKSQMQTNLTASQSYLSATDSALSQVSSLINDARSAALGVIGTTATDTQRQAVAQQVEQAIEQLIDTANIQYRGRYLFAGSDTGVQPFQALNGNVVSYGGNESRLPTFGNVDLLVDTSLQGDEAFGAISDAVQGTALLRPVLAFDTLLADLRGGRGIGRGTIAVSDGHSTSVVDLSKAETLGDVARLIRQHPPAGNAVDVEIGARGLILRAAAGELTISAVGGTTAADLGILTEPGSSSQTVVGADLDPALRGSARLTDILGARARAVLHPADADNDVIVQADHNGEDLNGVTVSLVDDGSVRAGSETAVYDAISRTLTVYVDDHRTTGRLVADAINNAHAADPAAMPFTASLDPLDNRNGGEGAVDSSLTPSAVTHNGSGADFDQSHGLQIVNGLYSETIDLSEAVTIEDFLNALNGSDVGLLAAINKTATGIDVRTRLSGADFAIGENGGATATQLGIRTLDAGTLLESLNYGSGVASAGEGVADFTITRNDGVSFDISIHGAKTVGDVIDLINSNPVNLDPERGVAVVARLAAFGNGIELADNSVGENRLTLTRASGSTAAIGLGLVESGQESRSSPTSGAGPDLLTGSDVNPQETEGLFTALVRLRQALLVNDNREIERAMALLDQASTDVTFSRAELGAHQQSLDALQTRLDTEDVQIQQDLSQEYDVDLAQVISDLTARQAALQASLKTIAATTQLTLLDYL